VAAERDALEAEGQREDLIGAGDAAVEAGDAAAAKGQTDAGTSEYDKALALYAQAAQRQDDDRIHERASHAEFRKQLATANALRAKHQWPAALAAYAKAKEVNPAGAVEVDAQVNTMNLEQEFYTDLKNGDDALAAGDFTGASGWYRKAQRVMNNDEVADRIKEATYRRYLTEGKRALEQGDRAGALANLKLARNSKDTDEVEKLIGQLEPTTAP
jgi:tetratricopeptide (TPR) repeat protein